MVTFLDKKNTLFYSKEKQKIQFHFQRFEFKYYFLKNNINEMYNILLKNKMIPDPFLEGKDYYLVTSLYFDNHELKCYHEKIDGLKNRAKLRLRSYNVCVENPETIFLEIKRKNSEIVIKERTDIDRKIYNDIIFNKNPFFDNASNKDNKTLRNFFLHQRLFSMKPVILVKYKRKPLVSKFDNNLRITFDFDLEAAGAKSFNDHQSFNPIFNNIGVMEIKYNNTLPAWLQRIIQKHDLSRDTLSKYCYGIDTIKYNYQLN